jgi:hypothetical protein
MVKMTGPGIVEQVGALCHANNTRVILTNLFLPGYNLPIMKQTLSSHCTAFAADRRIATGTPAHVALKVKALLESDPNATVLIFDDASGEQIDFNLNGTPEQVLQRLAPQAEPAAEPRGPGRPKLGVVAREVTLLPRHWDWLGAQPGGASVALRRLVEEAKRNDGGAELVRQAQQASLRFMSAIAGDRPGYEEATRALFAGQRERFRELTASWPADIRDHARKLAEASFQPASGPQGKS